MSEVAKENLSNLINSMDLKNIIFVDDYFNGTDDEIDRIVGYARTLIEEGNIEELKRAFNKEYDDVDIWELYFRENWISEDEIKQSEIIDKISSIYDDPSFKDRIYIPQLENLLKDVISFTPLSPDEWNRSKNTILTEATKNNKIIVLFDKELGDHYDGERLLLEVLAENNEFITSGLLTHTIEPGDGEWNKWNEIDYANKEHFYPLSKLRLDNDDFIVNGFKLLVLNRPCFKLKEQIKEEINNANKEVENSLDKIDISDFEQIIFKSSAIEGIHELDTILRVYYLYHRQSAQYRIHKNDSILEISKILRNVGSIPIKTSYGDAWKIQRLAIYDNNQILNENNISISLGDIFRSGKQFFILIAQPCDITVRKGGTRISKEATFVELFKGPPPNIDNQRRSIKNIMKGIEDNKVEKAIEMINKIDSPQRFFDLKYFNKVTGEDWHADFQKFFNINLSDLDWCVFNKNGRLWYNSKMTMPTNLTMGMQKRFIELKKEALKYKSGHYPKISLQPCIKATKNGNDLERVLRLKAPHSTDILNQYTNYISRVATEHDLARNY